MLFCDYHLFDVGLILIYFYEKLESELCGSIPKMWKLLQFIKKLVLTPQRIYTIIL
ncbi:hypothetical protein LEP1GSC079_5081 [Leptospira interrogans str. FPW1039]|uniref:Uncharacterized protein n=1 Tax=Leptospira interrogans str. FPW1039 TaxID=1193040 RepID=A0A0F6IL00_LEPIR|nr:hypothetical protein LEP1GSC079_5081 [Leptospira interrogans str. FPW1039]EMO00180.1 hypothetical protein LEP1GSC112_0884 [Leptospira interrogans serovar Pomona str. UT364]